MFVNHFVVGNKDYRHCFKEKKTIDIAYKPNQNFSVFQIWIRKDTTGLPLLDVKPLDYFARKIK